MCDKRIQSGMNDNISTTFKKHKKSLRGNETGLGKKQLLCFLLRPNSLQNVDVPILASHVKMRVIKSCKIDMRTYISSLNMKSNNLVILLD